MVQELAHHWATDYDWRRCEAKQLITGREELYFGFQFAKAANELPEYAVRYYVDILAADPDALQLFLRPSANPEIRPGSGQGRRPGINGQGYDRRGTPSR